MHINPIQMNKCRALLKILFDESRLQYIVNFTDYHNIDERFYNLIKDDLVSVSEN